MRICRSEVSQLIYPRRTKSVEEKLRDSASRNFEGPMRYLKYQSTDCLDSSAPDYLRSRRPGIED
jgi:hypothetical protein